MNASLKPQTAECFLGSHALRLLENLAQQLTDSGLKRMEVRELRRFRQFYNDHPQIRETVPPVLLGLPLADKLPLPEIRETLSPESSTRGTATCSKVANVILIHLGMAR